MGLKLDEIVPWGRSFLEYTQMFDLSPDDLQRRILDVAGGPASFNAEMNRQGHPIVSCDPIYQFAPAEIAQRLQETYPIVVETTRTHQHRFVWQAISSPDQLGQIRMAAMQQFLADFPQGMQERRYIEASLPNLPFSDRAFDLALCSHLLFTYSDHLSLEFHLAAIQEMSRVASQVRIFPLLVNMTGIVSPWLTPVLKALRQQGYTADVKPVPYEFQKGGNQLLQVASP